MTHQRMIGVAAAIAACALLVAVAWWSQHRPAESNSVKEQLYLRSRAHDAFRIIELDRDRQIATADQFLSAWIREAGSAAKSPISGATIRLNPDVELWRNPDTAPKAIAIISLDPHRQRKIAVTMELSVVEVSGSELPAWAK
jgi:hypothetical protein